VGRAPCPPRIRLRSRGAPARLQPCGLLWRKDQSVDPSVTHRVRTGPAGVPAPEPGLARRAIEREDPLLAVPVLEVSDVEVGGLGAEGRRDPARRGMARTSPRSGGRPGDDCLGRRGRRMASGGRGIAAHPQGSGAAPRGHRARHRGGFTGAGRTAAVPQGARRARIVSRHPARRHAPGPHPRDRGCSRPSGTEDDPSRACGPRRDRGRQRAGVSIFGHGQGGAGALPRGMGCVAPVYRPRDAEHTVLHQVIALLSTAGQAEPLGVAHREPVRCDDRT